MRSSRLRGVANWQGKHPSAVHACLLVLSYLLSGCTADAPDWRLSKVADQAELAQVVCDEMLAVEADSARVRKLAAMLSDRRIVYAWVEADDTRIEVTVRDVAFTVLDESGIIEVPADRKLKLLHGCQAGDDWVRIHVPILGNADFEEAQRQLAEE